jgi:RHS repeat-associated protein
MSALVRTTEIDCDTRAANEDCASGGPSTRTKYSYDAAGNTTSDGTRAYTFNQRGRLSQVTVGSNSTSYIYNALGQLIEKSGSAGTTLLVYDEAGHLLGEYTGSGAVIQETVWMGDIPVATLQPSGTSIATYYVHTDHLGTPRKITRPSDNSLMWRYDPDTFGSVAPNGNPSSLGTFIYNLRFPGQYYQAETGLNYNYFRDYDPQTGRYIESDPIGLYAGSYSTYSYANGNPVSHIDPTGLDVSILIKRDAYTSESVVGTISVTSTVAGAGSFNGFTLETASAGPNGDKLPIPPGNYEAFIRTDHSPNRVELQDVPGFRNVQIHNGNTADDVEGCFAVGTKRNPNKVLNSVAALNKILDIINKDGTGNITVQVSGPSTAPGVP